MRSFLFHVKVAAFALALGSSQHAMAIDIRFGHQMPVNHAFQAGAEEFARLVKEQSNGELQVSVFPAGQLGDEKSQIDQVRLGSLQMFLGTYGMLGNWLPSVSVFEAPYAIRDSEHFEAVEESDFFAKANQQMVDELGIRALTSWYLGTRHMMTNGFAVKGPEDLTGKKIRVPEAPLYIEMIKAMGGNATPFAYQEVYLGLSQGLLDGAENPVGGMYSFKYFEVADNLSMTGHLAQNMPLLVNEAFFDSLTEEQKQILVSAAKSARDLVNKRVNAEEAEAVDLMRQKGVTVTEPDLEIFRSRVAEALPPVFADKWGEGAYEAVQAIGR